MFSLCKAKINIKSVYLNTYKTIGDTYGTYNYISKSFMKTSIHLKIGVYALHISFNGVYKFHLNLTVVFEYQVFKVLKSIKSMEFTSQVRNKT